MNPSTVLARCLVDALIRLGVRHVVLCPGSRSSALAYALAAADPLPGDGGATAGRGLQLHVRIDERSAGFLALGLGKETGVPAVVVTTSGTAAANLHPAVLEASHAEVPLLVLSADRPHELRGTGANQTTDQVKLFGDAVRLFVDIPAPEGARPGLVRSWRNAVSRAVATALGAPVGRPGPVHLNLAFREPLVPEVSGGPGSGPGGAGAAAGARPEPVLGTDGLTRADAGVVAAPVWLPDGPRTVVLAGDGAGPVAATVAAGGGWPLLAEPSSGARTGPLAIGPYRLLLDHRELGGAIERVVVFGRPTLSRAVSRLLARGDVEVVVVCPYPLWTDATARAARVVPAARSVREHPDACRDGGDPAEPTGWLHRWLAAGRAATAALDRMLDDGMRDGVLTGPALAREVSRSLGPGEALVVGSSSAVRDLDLTGRPFPTPQPPEPAPVVLANRGLAGIDGTLSTGCGVALARVEAGLARPVRVLLGDLAFVHDVNGLLSGPAERRAPLQVIVLDDDGGGIFSLLEPGALAEQDAPGAGAAVFERVFATPSGADLHALCTAVGAQYVPVDRPADLRAALAGPAGGVSVVHVRAGRKERRAQAQALAEAVRVAVEAAIPG